MPGDNAATVGVGADVEFPQDGPSSASFTRLSPSSFQLNAVGTFNISFQVSVTEAGQLVVAVNNVELPYTVVGRATGTSQISGTCLINTTAITDTISIRNPVGNAAALTITPLAGGASPVSAHLVILRLA